MKHPRGYHSAAILLPDGSVIMGGDPNGGIDAERALSALVLLQAAPDDHRLAGRASRYGAAFSVQTATPGAIAEVVLMRAGRGHARLQPEPALRRLRDHRHHRDRGQGNGAADGNVAPPGHYLLFLVDHDRIPSEGAWIRLT